MKKKFTYFYILCIVLCLLGIFPESVQAAPMKLNKKNITTYVGKTTKLKVKNTKKKVTWKSSKPKVAKINKKGKITAKKAGTAVITAKVSKKKLLCKVTVKNPYLSQESATLSIGNTLKLILTGTTAKSWTSSNESVASVGEDGMVCALNAGIATITCTGADKKQYTCTITVMPNSLIWIPDTGNCEHYYVVTSREEPTCSEKGYVEKQCLYCGDYETKFFDPIPHTMKEYIQEASCYYEGKKYLQCEICGYWEDKETIPMTDHDIVETVEEPTCEKSGSILRECQYGCGIYEYTYLEMKEHQDEEVERVEPTCYESGHILYKCTGCGREETEYLSNEEAHNWEEEEIASTCESYGGIKVTCTKCGSNYWDSRKELLPHTYEWTVTDPTCEKEGYTLGKCTVCGTEELDEDSIVVATGHDYEREVYIEGSCTNDGITVEVCETCGNMDRSTFITTKAPGHAPKMRNKLGIYTAICGNCDEDMFTLDIYTSSANKAMTEVDVNTIHTVPGMEVKVRIDGDVEGDDEEITFELANGEKIDVEGEKYDFDLEDYVPYTYHYYTDGSSKYEDNLFTAWRQGTSKLNVCYNGEVVGEVIMDICYSLPEIVKLKWTGSNEDLMSRYTERYKEMVENAVAVLEEVITEDMTDYEKAWAIYTWMNENVTYGPVDDISQGQKAWQLLNNRESVCGGYAEGMNFFMDVLDIPCYYIISNPPTGDGHAWNMIKIDTGNGKGEQWYYVDATWVDFEVHETVDELNAKNPTPGWWGLHRAMDGWRYLSGGVYAGGESETEKLGSDYVSPWEEK